jgi:YD repeat-containing protein
MTYDSMNRQLKTYNDGTSSVNYCYDAPPDSYSNFPVAAQLGFVGHLTQSQNANSTTQYAGFDDLGRVSQSKHLTGGQTYTLNYTYDRAGNLTTSALPSGHSVGQTYGNRGQPQFEERPRSGVHFAQPARGEWARGPPLETLYVTTAVPSCQRTAALDKLN